MSDVSFRTDKVRLAAQVICDKVGAQWWPGQGKAKL